MEPTLWSIFPEGAEWELVGFLQGDVVRDEDGWVVGAGFGGDVGVGLVVVC